jgi:hypothetical protein
VKIRDGADAFSGTSENCPNREAGETVSRPLKNCRPYQHHGLHTLKGALATLEAENRGAWIEGLGEPGRALREWRAALIADLGGEDATSS